MDNKHFFRDDSSIIEEKVFIASFRKQYPQISDDSIQLIYRKFKDDWSRHPDPSIADRNLFYALVHFVNEMLRTEIGEFPVIKFEQLFKWREVTEITGETMLVCAYLAYKDSLKLTLNKTTAFDWPSLLLTDNRTLQYIFKKNRLIDLHQHLKASTSIFNISWICLMNHIEHRNRQFEHLIENKEKAKYYYDAVTLAAKIRLELYRRIMQPVSIALQEISHEIDGLLFRGIEINRRNIHFSIDQTRTETRMQQKCTVYDYAADNHGIMAIFNGERRLLYAAFKHIFEGDRLHISFLLYRYLLVKTKVRAEMVQINTNVGFANFATFERRKEIFIESYKEYADLLFILPMYEAKTYYFQDKVETRIAPQNNYKEIRKKYNHIKKLNEKVQVQNRNKNQNKYDYSSIASFYLIYHFIKEKEKPSNLFGLCRNFHVRKKVKKQASAIQTFLRKSYKNNVVGIDAANSELFCRPEVFVQAFEQLSLYPISRTYHVGEDFYDIADGLRAIDEAIYFLNLRRGDRLAHCLALGIHPEVYYAEHDYHLIIPRQILIDDMVWLKMKSMEWNVPIPPRLEKHVMEVMNIFNSQYGSQVKLVDYYEAIKLRKENPIKYISAKNSVQQIYLNYHYNLKLRKAMEVVEDFIVCPEYVSFIRTMQDKMIRLVEDKQLVIECCPSSNVKIGRLQHYEYHPIFRLCNVKDGNGNHLPVTVNTDDLGIFYTSLPREFELLSLALLKKKNKDGIPIYNPQEVYDWIERIVRNAHVHAFHKD